MTFTILRTESKSDFAKLQADVERDIGPTNFIERRYVDDIVNHTWDIQRYERVKTGIFDNALRKALARILYEILLPPGPTKLIERWMSSQRLSYWWLLDPESNRQIESLLKEAGLEKSAIEAEAYTLVADDLENVNRMLKSARQGWDKALRSVAKYRKSLAVQLRQNSDRVLVADQARLIAGGEEN